MPTSRSAASKNPSGYCAVNLLSSTLSNLSFSSGFPGLQVVASELQCVPEFMLCCGGTGFYEDIKNNGSVRCSLKARLNNSQELFAKICQRFGRPLGPQDLKTIVSALTERHRSILKQITPTQAKAYLIPRETHVEKSPLPRSEAAFSAMLMAASWILGLRVRYFPLDQTSLIKQHTQVSALGQCDVIAVSGLDRLSDPMTVDFFSRLIGESYDCMKPMLLECTPQMERQGAKKANDASPGFSRGREFHRRAEQIKSRNPFSFLPDADLSKLGEMLESRFSKQ